MIKTKIGGIVLGGLAGYLILSKGIGAIERGIRNICVAQQWKNYYKYGKEGNMVPPGYAMHRKSDGEGNIVEDNTGTVESMKKPEKEGSSNKEIGGKIVEVIAKAITDVFGGEKAAEGAKNGQTEASESDICPECCAECKIEKCPYEHLKYDGEITEWKDHRPVAGRYSWEDDKELTWAISENEVNNSNENDDDDIPALDFSNNPDGEFIEVKREKNEDEADSD